MAELMKARINADSLGELARRIKKNHPAFESEAFVSEILDADWDSLELKARIRKTALALGKTLPADYSQAVTILRQTAADYPAGSDGLMLMCLPCLLYTSADSRPRPAVPAATSRDNCG